MVVESRPLFRIQSFERVSLFFFHCVSVQLFWIAVLLGFLATFHPLFEGRRFLNFDEGRCSWSVPGRGLSIKAVHMNPWFSPVFFYLFQSGCFCFVALFLGRGWNHNHFRLSVGRSWGETQILSAAYLHVHHTKIGIFIQHKRGHTAPIHWWLVEDEGLGPGPSHSEKRVDVPLLAYLDSEISSWYKINII